MGGLFLCLTVLDLSHRPLPISYLFTGRELYHSGKHCSMGGVLKLDLDTCPPLERLLQHARTCFHFVGCLRQNRFGFFTGI